MSGQLRASYIAGSETFFIKPLIDLNIDHTFSSDFTETTNSGFGTLDISTPAETYVSLQPAIEVGGERTLANGTVVRPHASLGLTQFLTDLEPGLTASFAGAPQLSGFTHTGDFDRTYVDLEAGIDIFTGTATTVRAGAFASFSENSESYGGSLRIEIAF